MCKQKEQTKLIIKDCSNKRYNNLASPTYTNNAKMSEVRLRELESCSTKKIQNTNKKIFFINKMYSFKERNYC